MGECEVKTDPSKIVSSSVSHFYNRRVKVVRVEIQKDFMIPFLLLLVWVDGMCEFQVILDGKVVFRDVIYAKVDGDKVNVRDLLGEMREYRSCRIEEVDVNSTRLVLSTIEMVH